MNLKYRHIISIGLLLYGLLGLVSCTSESLELPREEEDDYNIFLTFQAAVVTGNMTDEREQLFSAVAHTDKSDMQYVVIHLYNP